MLRIKKMASVLLLTIRYSKFYKNNQAVALSAAAFFIVPRETMRVLVLLFFH